MLNRPVNRLEAFKAEQSGETRFMFGQESADSIEAFLFPHALDNSPSGLPQLRTVDTRARIICNHILNARRPGDASNANTCSCPHRHQRWWQLFRAPSPCSASAKPSRPLDQVSQEIVQGWLSRRATAEVTSHKESSPSP